MSTPHVAGAWALLRQADPAATVDEILTVLQDTGVPITDARNGVTKSRIQVDAALPYMTGGFLGDSDSNLIPDRSDVILVPSADSGRGAIDIAARIGLESTGISIPLAVPADQVEKPELQSR